MLSDHHPHFFDPLANLFVQTAAHPATSMHQISLFFAVAAIGAVLAILPFTRKFSSISQRPPALSATDSRSYKKTAVPSEQGLLRLLLWREWLLLHDVILNKLAVIKRCVQRIGKNTTASPQIWGTIPSKIPSFSTCSELVKPVSMWRCTLCPKKTSVSLNAAGSSISEWRQSGSHSLPDMLVSCGWLVRSVFQFLLQPDPLIVNVLLCVG